MYAYKDFLDCSHLFNAQWPCKTNSAHKASVLGYQKWTRSKALAANRSRYQRHQSSQVSSVKGSITLPRASYSNNSWCIRNITCTCRMQHSSVCLRPSLQALQQSAKKGANANLLQNWHFGSNTIEETKSKAFVWTHRDITMFISCIEMKIATNTHAHNTQVGGLWKL